ncbi:MAG TPA: hypothetical protein VFW07_03155 [Parafilimonas sp.]|nr:hypothetical protein [Parafilimonas sp.]
MSNIKTFEVKLQLDGGRTIVTTVSAESDYRARQVIHMQYGDIVKSVHYVREIK